MFPHPAAIDHAPPFHWPPSMAGNCTPPSRLALLECIESLRPNRVLVLGEESLEILCALIRIGCEAASEMRAAERPDPHSADLAAAVMPRLHGNLAHLLSQARRALVPAGWMALQADGDPAGSRAWHGGLLLRQAGFLDIRSIGVGGSAILLARSGTPGHA